MQLLFFNFKSSVFVMFFINDIQDPMEIHEFSAVFISNKVVLQETMTFGKNFNQKLDNVQLPENLQLLRPSARRDTRRMKMWER